MKKTLKTLIATFFAAIMLVAFAACSSAFKEVAGTYELSSVSGTVNGVTITEDSYEYFRLILDEKGNGTVQSKGAGLGAVAYEAKGTYTYADGKIKMTTQNGATSVTEEYDYADGVITYTVDMEQMKFTLKLTKVTPATAE